MYEPTHLDPYLVRVRLWITRAFELIHGGDAGLERLDREVVLDALEMAGAHATGALLALHPEWDDLDDESFEDLMFEIDSRYQDRVAEGADDPTTMVRRLLRRAYQELLRAEDDLDLAQPAIEVVDDLEEAIGCLEPPLFLLDPDSFCLGPNASPAERVRRAAQIEGLEHCLEESRALVRSLYRRLR